MPFSKRSLGLELTPQGLSLSLISGGARTPRVERWQQATFAERTLRLSRREPNVNDPHAFLAALTEAYQRLLTKERSLCLSLPDAVGRVVLLDLEARFKSREEGLDIIRWKLKKSLPYDIGSVHLDYQTLAIRDNGAISLLVSLVSRGVVSQYEELLAQAGLEARIIDFTSFNLYRLFSSRLELSDNGAFVTYYGGAMTILIFYDGVLSFYRTKELIRDDTQTLYREVNSSLLVYGDYHPGQPIGEVFCLAPVADAEPFRAVVAEASGLEPILLDPERLVLVPPGVTIAKETFYTLSGSLGAALRSFG